jgi:hypothetical protein
MTAVIIDFATRRPRQEPKPEPAPEEQWSDLFAISTPAQDAAFRRRSKPSPK